MDFGTMSVAVFRALLSSLANAGVDADALLRQSGISYETMREPESRIATEIAFRIFDDAPRLSGDADFGIHAGERIPMGSFEVLDHATRTSRTVGEALTRMVRFYALLFDRIELKLEIHGDKARVTHRAPPPIVSPRAAVEMLFTTVVARGETLSGKTWPIERVRFVHARPASTLEHERIFHAALEFGQPIDEILFARSWLDQPLVTADAGVSEALERFARALLAKLPAEDDFLSRVRRCIAETLSGANPSLNSSARRLGMSARTFQRKLGEAGTSYNALTEDVRRELAVSYLSDPKLTVTDVAYLLGFSEGSGFHRAFRRWTGQTPNEYRTRAR